MEYMFPEKFFFGVSSVRTADGGYGRQEGHGYL